VVEEVEEIVLAAERGHCRMQKGLESGLRSEERPQQVHPSLSKKHSIRSGQFLSSEHFNGVGANPLMEESESIPVKLLLPFS